MPRSARTTRTSVSSFTVVHIGGSARILPDRARHSASHDTVARLRAHGAKLLGEIAQFESIFLLCYLRGPAGIIVALAEQIG